MDIPMGAMKWESCQMWSSGCIQWLHEILTGDAEIWGSSRAVSVHYQCTTRDPATPWDPNGLSWIQWVNVIQVVFLIRGYWFHKIWWQTRVNDATWVLDPIDAMQMGQMEPTGWVNSDSMGSYHGIWWVHRIWCVGGCCSVVLQF